jgi:hypothetical protein
VRGEASGDDRRDQAGHEQAPQDASSERTPRDGEAAATAQVGPARTIASVCHTAREKANAICVLLWPVLTSLNATLSSRRVPQCAAMPIRPEHRFLYPIDWPQILV